MKKRNGKYPFDIFNTDKHSKSGTHWWRILDIYPPPKIFLFDSLVLDGFNFFAVDNDKNAIDKLLYNFNSC